MHLNHLLLLQKLHKQYLSKKTIVKAITFYMSGVETTNNDKLTFDMRTLVTFNFTRGQISSNQVHTRQMFPVGKYTISVKHLSKKYELSVCWSQEI